MSTEPEKNLYAERDIEALSPLYMLHLDRMTREKLHGKSEIAAELAWRDARIIELEARVGVNVAVCDGNKRATPSG